MKSFTQFITEAKDRYDREGTAIGGGGSSHRGGDKIGYDRKLTTPEKKRVKAVGGGKTAPAKDYKRRKDAGQERPKGKESVRLQQPTQKRGSAALSAKESQRKAYLERKKRSAAKDEVSGKDKKIDLQKSATKLLTKKKDSVSPKYKPAKASGYTRPERRKLQRAGDRLLKDIAKKKEKSASHYDPKL
jgi:hypothetical protein